MRPISVSGPTGQEWPHAIVDAPDAYYSYARVRLEGLTVVVFDQRGKQVASYELDAPVHPAAGAFAGMVNGVPFTVARDCDCGHGFGFREKGI